MSGNSASSFAGGILNTANLTLTGSTVSDNTAASEDGGIGNYGGALALVDSTVSGNSAVGAGGIGNDDSGTATFLDSSVSGNSASAGGGISNASNLTLTDSTVSGNTATNDAGILNAANLTLIGSTISGNTAALGNGGIGNYGGARTHRQHRLRQLGLRRRRHRQLRQRHSNPRGQFRLRQLSQLVCRRILNSASLTLTDSTVSGNAAINDAGILNTANLTLIGSSVSGNAAAVGNSGIGNDGGALTVVDSIVSGDSAVAAGGIDNVAPSMLTESIAVSGISASSAGGIGNLESDTAMLLSTVSGNSASVGDSSAIVPIPPDDAPVLSGMAGDALTPIEDGRSVNDGTVFSDSTDDANSSVEAKVRTLSDGIVNSGLLSAPTPVTWQEPKVRKRQIVLKWPKKRCPSRTVKIPLGIRTLRRCFPNRLSKASSTGNRPSTREWTAGDLAAGLLLLLPWLPDGRLPIEEEAAQPHKLLERGEDCV